MNIDLEKDIVQSLSSLYPLQEFEEKAIDTVLNAIPHWIPVTERLPEEEGEYLVTKHTIGWNCEEYDVNDIAYFDDDGFHKADKVIAWMPLPEPYKGVTE